MLGKHAEQTQQGPTPLELLEQQMLDLREQIQKTNERLDKFSADVTAALNVLDNDILDLKDESGKSGFSGSNELVGLNKKISDLSLIGRLALDHNDRLSHLEYIIEKNFKDSQLKGKEPSIKAKRHSKK